MTPEQLVLTRTKEILLLAQQLYGVDTGNVVVRFDLAGRTAAQAFGSRNNDGTGFKLLAIRYNQDMLHREAFACVYNALIPHEVGHLVCFLNPALGSGHDEGWVRVCKALGGTGEEYHDEVVVYSRGNTYEYISTLGQKIRVSQQVHNRIQAGVEYAWRSKGNVNLNCQFIIVGSRGRTLKDR